MFLVRCNYSVDKWPFRFGDTHISFYYIQPSDLCAYYLSVNLWPELPNSWLAKMFPGTHAPCSCHMTSTSFFLFHSYNLDIFLVSPDTIQIIAILDSVILDLHYALLYY